VSLPRVTPPAGREPLEALARWQARFEDPGFSIGSWVKSTIDDQGRIHMPWFEYSREARDFLADVGRNGWIQVFDWGTWASSPDGRRILEQPGGIEGATAEDLVRILTAIVRSDRFTEGSIAGAFDSGLLTRVVRRAGELARLAAPHGSSASPERIDL
jgi:hypothetical protein